MRDLVHLTETGPKIIKFLKKKGVSENKIIEAYSSYYKDEGLYEIIFKQRPLGFSVIMDTRGKNAIVSSVQDETNGKLGVKIASRVYEINGKRVDDMKHKVILKLMAQQPTPFYVVFKESGYDSDDFGAHVDQHYRRKVKDKISLKKILSQARVELYGDDDGAEDLYKQLITAELDVARRNRERNSRMLDYSVDGNDFFRQKHY